MEDKTSKEDISANFPKLKVVYIPIRNLDPNDYNPNRLSDEEFELLMRSIQEDGFTQPILITPDFVIIDGEHRWRIAETLNIHEVPAVILDLTPDEMRLTTIRHNKARGAHDEDLEAALLQDLANMGDIDWVLDSLMIGEDALDALIEDVGAGLEGMTLDIEVDDAPLVTMDDEDLFAHAKQTHHPLVPLMYIEDVTYADGGDLVPAQGEEPDQYVITLGYTHGDGYIMRSALGPHALARVTQLIRRGL